MKKSLLMIAISFLTTLAYAQHKQDTVIVWLGQTSKVVFTMQDPEDIETLRHYDFQRLFQDILTRLEKKDTTALSRNDAMEDIRVPDEEDETESATADVKMAKETNDHQDDSDDDDHDEDWGDIHVGSRHWGKTWQSFNFDLGTNNYLSNGKFPDRDNAPYSVRPWGSWYFAFNSTQRTRIGRKFFIEWGLGMSWYTFKFEKDNIVIQKNDNGIQFIEDTRDVDFKKSKLSISFIQASLLPVLDFGDHSRKPRFWDGYGNSFRIGLGPYIGYRIGSHSKLVYADDGREKDKNRDSFYLNNFRYGARLQLGYRSTDLFFNYDLNELFASGKGPALNAFSFGVIF